VGDSHTDAVGIFRKVTPSHGALFTLAHRQ
jgi:hypothetical protein